MKHLHISICTYRAPTQSSEYLRSHHTIPLRLHRKASVCVCVSTENSHFAVLTTTIPNSPLLFLDFFGNTLLSSPLTASTLFPSFTICVQSSQKRQHLYPLRLFSEVGFYLVSEMEEHGLGDGGIGGLMGGDVVFSDEFRQQKAEIVAHPLCEQLIAAHVGCLRVATPIDQLHLIDAQLPQCHNLLRFYASQQTHSLSPHQREELDTFLAQYLSVLSSFKEQLQQHLRVHAVEAVMACREIEQDLQNLTGATIGDGTGATMSDDEEDLPLDYALDQTEGDAHEMMGFGPSIPTEFERSLMDRVRRELKLEFKQGFKSRIEDVREEILRKRRAGKLPGDTTSVLKSWWQQHSKWPYPTEDEKAKLVEETGLQLKQINNWFINQRKRNWHSNSQSPTSLKSKRKR